MDGREYRLRDALAPVLDDYDFILMDCPPALNMLTVNGLVAADAVMIPMQCEYYALEGLTDLVATLKKVRANLNSKLEIEGLLRTLFDPRSTLTQQVSGELVDHFGSKVYRTIIPRNVRLAEAPSYGKPVTAFDRLSKGAQAYMALAQEIMERRQAAPPETVAQGAQA
jgi:chromosome partitioning protein